MDIWKEIKEYKDILGMAPIVLAILGQKYFGTYGTDALILSLVPLFTEIFVMDKIAKLQGGVRNWFIADVWGTDENGRDIKYPGGNNRVQFCLGESIRIRKVSKDLYYMVQECVEPFVMHPVHGEIHAIRAFCQYPPNLLFTGKKTRTIEYLSEYPEVNHCDVAVMYEREDMTYTDKHGHTDPVYDVIHGTQSYAFARGQYRQVDIEEAEKLMEAMTPMEMEVAGQ